MTTIKPIIIGGGPAGSQCALWLANLGFHPILIEKTSRLGGLLCTSPFPNDWLAGDCSNTGEDLATRMHQHLLMHQHIEFYFQHEIISVEKCADHSFKLHTRSPEQEIFLTTRHLVLATGVTPRTGSFTTRENILIGPGRQICEFDFANKRVAILGGGDNAVENYLFIAKRAPKTLHIYARTLRARSALVRAVPNAVLHLGDYQCTDAGHFIIHSAGQSQVYDVIVVMYGWQTQLPRIIAPQPLAHNPEGFVVTDNHRCTNIAGLYAIGELTQAAHPCVATAFSDGVIAAKAIQHDIETILRQETMI